MFKVILCVFVSLDTEYSRMGEIPKHSKVFPAEGFLSFKLELTELFEKNAITINGAQAELFERFFSLIIKGNERMNLTSLVEPNTVIVKHFIDSVLPAYLIPENARVADLGSGAGFPGIPLKILRNDISLVMVESTGKKANFLVETLENLNLNKTSVEPLRAEQYGKAKGRNRFDIVTARAIASLNILVEYALPLLKIGGIFIAYKGPNVTDEIEQATKAAALLGGVLRETKKYSLNGEFERSVVLFEKTWNTPSEYPRENRIILKKPLG